MQEARPFPSMMPPLKNRFQVRQMGRASTLTTYSSAFSARSVAPRFNSIEQRLVTISVDDMR